MYGPIATGDTSTSRNSVGISTGAGSYEVAVPITGFVRCTLASKARWFDCSRRRLVTMDRGCWIRRTRKESGLHTSCRRWTISTDVMASSFGSRAESLPHVPVRLLPSLAANRSTCIFPRHVDGNVLTPSCQHTRGRGAIFPAVS